MQGVIAFAAALALGGCAAHPAPSTGSPLSANTLAPGAGAVGAKSNNQYRGYNQVVRDGQTYYCEVTPVTGSLFGHEICFTQAQLDAQREKVQRLQDDVRQAAPTRARPTN